MGLDVKIMEYNTLYKILDERDSYFTRGVWYISKHKKDLLSKKPFIYVYHFDLNGKVIDICYGDLINYGKYQCGVEFSIKGWQINKNSIIDEIGDKNTKKEMTFTYETLAPVPMIEQDLLGIETSEFLMNPVEYFNRENNKCYK